MKERKILNIFKGKTIGVCICVILVATSMATAIGIPQNNMTNSPTMGISSARSKLLSPRLVPLPLCTF